MANKIEDIASEHLGKAGDGTVVKPYETPDHVDSSLLVPVPRSLNRAEYNLQENNLPFVGFDTWNCYEVSYLHENGYPATGILKIIYPAFSLNIVESKSLKLYLNSYNMHRFGSTLEVERRIESDLARVLETNQVDVRFVDSVHNKSHSLSSSYRAWYTYNHDDLIAKLDPIEISKYDTGENPELLKIIDCHVEQTCNFQSSLLRSNCRVTNQPDWGDVFIYTEGRKIVYPASLLRYIVSLRCENHFHEEICEMIFKRLYDKMPGCQIFVACLYTRRGGIDINPVRATSATLLSWLAAPLFDKTVTHEKTPRQ